MKNTTAKLLKQPTSTTSQVNKDLDFIEMSLERQKISHNYQISLIKKFGTRVSKLWNAYFEANKTFVKAHHINIYKI